MDKARRCSPLVAQEGRQPCQDFEFSPVRPCQTSDLQNRDIEPHAGISVVCEV